jgi:hypothetical protein
MLRSMIIGLAVAALLQVGVHYLSPAGSVALAAKRIDWVQVQTNALAHLIGNGFTSLTR